MHRREFNSRSMLSSSNLLIQIKTNNSDWFLLSIVKYYNGSLFRSADELGFLVSLLLAVFDRKNGYLNQRFLIFGK